LKTVNFDNFLNFQNYDNFESNNYNNDLTFCDTAYIGNAKNEFGISQSSNKLICNNLICAKCDKKVSSFVNKKWNENCDYVFIKNNHGDQNKLSEVKRNLFRK
jgi:hypothetical protein